MSWTISNRTFIKQKSGKEGEKIYLYVIPPELASYNAEAIAKEIGADLKVIDPLSEDWLTSTSDIINSVYESLTESLK